jgi:hypothetical protein
VVGVDGVPAAAALRKGGQRGRGQLHHRVCALRVVVVVGGGV